MTVFTKLTKPEATKFVNEKLTDPAYDSLLADGKLTEDEITPFATAFAETSDDENFLYRYLLSHFQEGADAGLDNDFVGGAAVASIDVNQLKTMLIDHAANYYQYINTGAAGWDGENIFADSDWDDEGATAEGVRPGAVRNAGAGAKIVSNENGNETIIEEDGSKTLIAPDGTATYYDPDGKKIPAKYKAPTG